jgi:hypothetical protein
MVEYFEFEDFFIQVIYSDLQNEIPTIQTNILSYD